ncbi:unnamed protein product [Candida parapsilosis]
MGVHRPRFAFTKFDKSPIRLPLLPIHYESSPIIHTRMRESVNRFLMHNLITCRVDAQVTTVNATELDSEISTLYGLLGKSDREVLSAGQKCQSRPAVSK